MNRRWGILNLGVHRLISNGPLAARRGLGMGGVLREGTIELKPPRIDPTVEAFPVTIYFPLYLS